MPPHAAVAMCAVRKRKAKSNDYLRVLPPAAREEELPPDERIDELPDERTVELLPERIGAALERLMVVAEERETVERVAVGVVETLLTVLEDRTGVETRVVVFCERVAV